MRLKRGVTLDRADDVLRRAETKWANTRSSASNMFQAYADAVHETYPALQEVFDLPDVAAGLRSPAYWNLLEMGDAYADRSVSRRTGARNGALTIEIENQRKALADARRQLNSFKEYATRPGLPVVYDTNMLNHWQQPGDLRWKEIFKNQGENVPHTRLVIPLRVVDELDRQKYGAGTLAKKATAAIRYLERVLKDNKPGEPVELRPGVHLEVWFGSDDRGTDADLAILRCALDLAALHSDVRVLSDDTGMRLRAQRRGLKVMRLPEEYRKPEEDRKRDSANAEVVPEPGAAASGE